MKRFMKKEPTPVELVAEAMSDELGFEVTKEQAIQRLCNQYLNTRSSTSVVKEKK
tara:strand:- start:100 stop:264 length:165 start_codon:yes stop_codon:yes gene_type:complete